LKFKTKQVIKKMQEPISQMHMKTFLLPKSQYQAQRDVEKKERDKRTTIIMSILCGMILAVLIIYFWLFIQDRNGVTRRRLLKLNY